MEKKALECFARNNTFLRVSFCGRLLNPKMPLLIVQPDGIAAEPNGELRLLEVKSPEKLKYMTFEQFFKPRNFSWGIHLINDGLQLYLRQSSQYYKQIQMFMFVSRIKVCHLILYSQSEDDYREIIVTFDEFYCQNLMQELYNLYANYLFEFYEEALKHK